LQRNHPGPVTLLPEDRDKALDVRTLDRYFDNYVMTPVQQIVSDFMRDPADRDALNVTAAQTMLQSTYSWLDKYIHPDMYACGEEFTLADCAAAPALLYADWVDEIGREYGVLKRYRAKLLARPSVKRCVDDARPYRSLFPPGAPDRD
jgi:glutathione S-transferase